MRDISLPHLTATRLLTWWREVAPGDKAIPTPIDDIVRALGFAVATFHAAAHPGTLGYLEPGEDLIFLRAELPEPIRRFTLAHELGHALMHRRSPSLTDQSSLTAYDAASCAETDLETPLDAWGLGDEALRPGQAYSARAQRETEANQFASMLLLPAEQLQLAFRGDGANVVSVRMLARRFAVSEEVALRRLAALLTAEPDGASTSGEQEGAGRADAVAELDEAQRAAAQSPTPALVIAGPGTGKTTALVGRVAWLIHEQGVSPERILALTFSNKAAREMRARVGRLLSEETLPPEETDEMGALRQLTPVPAISTIHAYCGDLLRRYGPLVGLRPDFLLVSQTEGYFLLRSLVERLPLTYYQPVTAPSHYYPDLLAAISRAKDELVDPAQYKLLAQAALDAASTTEDREQAERACEVARVYSAYQAALDERGDADFGDIVRLAARLLAEYPDALADARARHTHVLVDEFQDINRAMGVFLRTLTGEIGALWAVGDADQAIYRFRGASPANIQRFREDYPGAHRRRLLRNYRSRAPILSAAASVAQRSIPSEERQPLRATRGQGDTPSVRLATAPDEASELAGIVQSIRTRLAQGRAFTDIAVLCRTRRGARKIIDALTQAEIPTRVIAPLLEQDEVKRLLSVVLLLTDTSGAGLLRAGQLDAHPIPREDVLRLLEASRAQGVAPLAYARASLDEAPELSPTTKQSLRRLLEVTAALRLAPDVVTGLTRYLFDLTTLGRELLLDTAAGDEVARLRAAHITRLLALARAFEDQPRSARPDSSLPRPGDARWTEFLEYVRVLTELRQDGAGSEELVASAEAGVWVLTVHASKGLEFPVVLLPGLAERRFPVQPRHDFAPAPPGMLDAPNLEYEADPHVVEEACLFYVAMTRARDDLLLSVAERYGATAYRPSRFLASVEAQLGASLARERWQRVTSAAESTRPPAQRPASTPEGPPLTAFALETYQRCPRQFAYRYVDRLQPHSAGMMTLQTALNRSLDALHERMRTAPGSLTKNAALALFETTYDEARGARSEDDPYAPLYRRYGRLALEREWQALMPPANRAEEPAPDMSERDREIEILVDGTIIQVTIDQVEHLRRAASSAPRRPDVAGERYVRRKLGATDDRGSLREFLYTLAAEQLADGGLPAQVALRQVATGETTPVHLSERRRATLRRDLQTILDGIRREEYPARPDARVCAACPFLLICPT